MATATKPQPLVLDLETAPLGSTVPAPATPAGPLTTFDRFMADPAVDVDKLERLMQMHERMQARTAEEQFNAAMSAAQTEMRPVATDADNPQTRSRYATYAKLDRALRPIYTKHGFGMSFDTGDAPKDDYVRILCYVTHGGGHARTYKIDMPADGKGAKGGDVMTKTHATGAGASYGMRYLLKMIWNVAVGEDDRDGNVIKPRSEAPAGFEDWQTDLQAVADEGLPKLQATWQSSKPDFKRHFLRTDQAGWEALKKRAAKVTA